MVYSVILCSSSPFRTPGLTVLYFAYHFRAFVSQISFPKDFVTNAEIYENEVETCGIYDWEFNDGGENGKNGEGVCE